MAEEVGSAAGKTVTMAALKSFMNPSLDIIKTIPQGIIELALRGSAAVRSLICVFCGFKKRVLCRLLAAYWTLLSALYN